MKFNKEWLRIRNETGKYILNYKKKTNKLHYKKYDVLIDSINNINVILKSLGINPIGTISKNRTIYIYKEKYVFSFDIVEKIGMFIELKLINTSKNFEKDFYDLINILKYLKIDLNLIERKKYIDCINKNNYEEI